MIEMDSLLVKCPHCGAWPMAANFPKGGSAQREILFKRTRCQHVRGGHLRRGPPSSVPEHARHISAQGPARA